MRGIGAAHWRLTASAELVISSCFFEQVGLIQFVVESLQADTEFFGGFWFAAVVSLEGTMDRDHFNFAVRHAFVFALPVSGVGPRVKWITRIICAQTLQEIACILDELVVNQGGRVLSSQSIRPNLLR